MFGTVRKIKKTLLMLGTVRKKQNKNMMLGTVRKNQKKKALLMLGAGVYPPRGHLLGSVGTSKQVCATSGGLAKMTSRFFAITVELKKKNLENSE